MFLKRTGPRPSLHLLPIALPPSSDLSFLVYPTVSSRGRGRCPQRGRKKNWVEKMTGLSLPWCVIRWGPFTDVHAHRAAVLSIISAPERVRTPSRSCACASKRDREREREKGRRSSRLPRERRMDLARLYVRFAKSSLGCVRLLIVQYHVRDITLRKVRGKN